MCVQVSTQDLDGDRPGHRVVARGSYNPVEGARGWKKLQ